METPGFKRPSGQIGGLPHATGGGRKRSRWLGWVALFVAAIVLVVVILVGAVLVTKNDPTASNIKKSQFQAVFLTNGQVYFGKITSLTKEGITLTDIYYLQVQQQVQPDSSNSKTSTETDQKNQQLSLAKLGGELHAPEDKMFINHDQLLFWENLKDDGKVVQAIKNNGK